MDFLGAACAGHSAFGSAIRHSDQHLSKKWNKTARLGSACPQRRAVCQIGWHVLTISAAHGSALGDRWAAAGPPEAGIWQDQSQDPERLLAHSPLPRAGGSERGGVGKGSLFSSEELVKSSTGNLLSYISESSLHMSCFYKKKPKTDLKLSVSSLPSWKSKVFPILAVYTREKERVGFLKAGPGLLSPNSTL